MHRVAIIGSGTMAKVHARHWANIDGAEVVAMASRDPERVAELAANSGATVYTGLDELLAGTDVDVIDICTPTFTHKDLALAALAADKHTFLEKPMGLTLEECDAIAAAHVKSGVVMMVGHVLRFFPEFESAKKLVADGAVGNVAAVRSARLADHPRGSWQNWYGDPAKSGGVILDLMIHDIDWMRWCFGPVDRVFAKGLHANPEFTGKLDYALVTLHFVSGAVGHICGSWAHPVGFRTQFEICGDAGMLEHDSRNVAPLTVSKRRTDDSRTGVAIPESPLFAADDPYFRELQHFAQCIDTGIQPSITLADARNAVEIALAAQQSIKTGQPVSL